MFNRILIYLYRLCRNQRVLFGSIPHPGCKRQRCFSLPVPQKHRHSRRWRRGFVYYNCLAKMTIILILPMFHPKHNQNQNTFLLDPNQTKKHPQMPKTPKTKNGKNTLHTFNIGGAPPSLQMGFHCHPLRLAPGRRWKVLKRSAIPRTSCQPRTVLSLYRMKLRTSEVFS